MKRFRWMNVLDALDVTPAVARHAKFSEEQEKVAELTVHVSKDLDGLLYANHSGLPGQLRLALSCKKLE